MSTAYEHLARLSVFVKAARYGEMTSQHDRHHTQFEELFHRLEADSTGGLFTVMCALSEVYRSLGSADLSDAMTVIDQDVVDAVRMIRLHRPRNHALRHIRDFTVATSVLNVAQRLSSDARQLVQHYRH